MLYALCIGLNSNCSLNISNDEPREEFLFESLPSEINPGEHVNRIISNIVLLPLQGTQFSRGIRVEESIRFSLSPHPPDIFHFSR